MSAVGQHRLMRLWQDGLDPHDTLAGQVLLAPLDFVHRTQYLHARGTLRHLVDLGVVPVVNENDAVADEEIRFGDNDRLAALVAHLVGAQLLVLLTDAPGLLTADPRHDREASLIEEVVEIDQQLEQPGRRAGQRGGQRRHGVEAGRGQDRHLVGRAHGDRRRRPARRARRRAGRRGRGGHGVPGPREPALGAQAVDRLRPRRRRAASPSTKGRGSPSPGGGRSLLAAGVVGVDGAFGPEDAVEIAGPDGAVFAKGLVRVPAATAEEWMGRRSQVVVHRDDLVLVT